MKSSLLALMLLTSITLSTAHAQRLQVVASHSILADVVANVAADAAEVRSLMPLGADPHSFTPRPSDLVALARADVIFINGAGFEEGLLEAINNAGSDMTIAVASSCVEMLGFADHNHDAEHDHDEHSADAEHDHDDPTHDETYDDSAIAQLCEQHVREMAALHGHSYGENNDNEHDHDVEHDDHDADEHTHDEHTHDDPDQAHEVTPLGRLYALECDSYDHSDRSMQSDADSHDDAHNDAHNHGACDPHVWMQPHNVMYWTMFIRDTLSDLDPTNADTYSANARDYLETLDALAHDVITPLANSVPAANRVLITNHHAFGYFAAAYDFEIVETIIPGGSTLAEPSAADIARVIDLVRARGVPAIFAETTVSDTISRQIANETGARVAVLYSGSLSAADEPASTYLDYLRYNVNTIVDALGGSQ